jgi:hypothetical protein
MATKKAKPVTQRNAGPIDMGGGTRFPLGRNQCLEFVQGVHRLVFGEDSFLVVLYGGLNACGLIGTEYNGIAVLWENEGKVALMDHCRGPAANGKVNEEQRREYARICVMNKVRFKVFVNEHPDRRHMVMTPAAVPIVMPRLTRLVGSKASLFQGEKDFRKRDFLVALFNFLCFHCNRDRFTRRVYDGLHLHLNHIAHYDMDGFYAEWFSTPAATLRFLRYHVDGQVWGPWRDVDEAFKVWIVHQEGRKVLNHYLKEAARGQKG